MAPSHTAPSAITPGGSCDAAHCAPQPTCVDIRDPSHANLDGCGRAHLHPPNPARRGESLDSGKHRRQPDGLAIRLERRISRRRALGQRAAEPSRDSPHADPTGGVFGDRQSSGEPGRGPIVRLTFSDRGFSGLEGGRHPLGLHGHKPAGYRRIGPSRRWAEHVGYRGHSLGSGRRCRPGRDIPGECLVLPASAAGVADHRSTRVTARPVRSTTSPGPAIPATAGIGSPIPRPSTFSAPGVSTQQDPGGTTSTTSSGGPVRRVRPPASRRQRRVPRLRSLRPSAPPREHSPRHGEPPGRHDDVSSRAGCGHPGRRGTAVTRFDFDQSRDRPLYKWCSTIDPANAKRHDARDHRRGGDTSRCGNLESHLSHDRGDPGGGWPNDSLLVTSGSGGDRPCFGTRRAAPVPRVAAPMVRRPPERRTRPIPPRAS